MAINDSLFKPLQNGTRTETPLDVTYHFKNHNNGKHYMTLVRAFDNEATSLQRQGELGLWAQSLGQEAAQIGSGRALAPQDYVFPSYREHGVACAHRA